MIYTYISKTNSIILAITPANTDISTSDALNLSREVDPDGERTLGVITKIDIMDKGTDVFDVLTGKVIPLRLGFIGLIFLFPSLCTYSEFLFRHSKGVINRSQQDIISGKPIREALKSEQEFFQNHPLYKGISSRCGTGYLTKTLNKCDAFLFFSFFLTFFCLFFFFIQNFGQSHSKLPSRLAKPR
jgi:dynamin 1-like protein